MSIPLQNFRPRRTNRGSVPTSYTNIWIDPWKNYCIYKVPAHIKDQNPKAYTPQLVSIGPYHHGKPHLFAMEEHKTRALQRFIVRTEKTYIAYYEALKGKYEVIVNSYQSLSEEWKGDHSRDRLVHLMVLDGAFLYEFMRGFTEDGWDYEERDPVFSPSAFLDIGPYVLPDILMLENQLPLTVLERLIAVAEGHPDQTYDREVYNLVFQFFSVAPPSNMQQKLGSHVLDVTRKVITREFEQTANIRNEPPVAVKSAMELHRAGVKFGKSEIHGNRGVSFDNGILKLPPLTFDTITEPLFLNAIAFECLHPDANHEVSSYIAFMQGLIASPNDANYLMSLNLIQSSIGDHRAVAAVMKNISKNVLFDPFSDLCKVRDSLNKYSDDHMGKWNLLFLKWDWQLQMWDRRLREWRTDLHQNYLKNPWTITAVIGATIILILTLLQTIYTMKGYYEGNNKN